jgi:signal recognition particle subunit SRP72
VNAADIYKRLAQNGHAEDESDLRINGGATDAQLQWSRQGDSATRRKPAREDLEAFESAYNAACGCIARGELGQGEVLLKRAKDLCLSSDVLSEDEKNDELLPITVQQLYVLSSQGKKEQAESLLSEISIAEYATTSPCLLCSNLLTGYSVPDKATRMVAQMNQLNASTGPVNPYMQQRIVASYSKLSKNDRLFDFQHSIATQNQTALDLLASKFNGVAKSTARVISNSPSPSISSRVTTAGSANAAAQSRNQLGRAGLKLILPLLEKRPTDIGLLATVIQLYILANNFGAAITVLEGFIRNLDATDASKDVRFAPGLVAIIVSLYSAEGRRSHVRSELAKAASHWRRKPKCPPELLRVAGLSLLSSGEEADQREAGQIFETLCKQDPSDTFARAGLVAALASTDLQKVCTEAENLTPVNRLVVGIDVDALDAAGVPQSQDAASAIINRKRAGAAASKSKRKKVRLPKDYDSNKKPDPERWLPLRDRSTYRAKGRKGKQKQAALTQGGIEKENVPAEGQKAPQQPAPTVAGGGGKAKKKKGKK